VGGAAGHRGPPGAGLVQGVAQRLGLDVPDTPGARDVRLVVIPAGAGVEPNAAAGMSAMKPSRQSSIAATVCKGSLRIAGNAVPGQSEAGLMASKDCQLKGCAR
jgi:hypothetical protein